MSKVREILKILSEKSVITSIAFFVGLINVVLNTENFTRIPQIFINPLGSMIRGLIMVSFYSCCASFVRDLFPTNLQLLVSICLILSMIFHILQFVICNLFTHI